MEPESLRDAQEDALERARRWRDAALAEHERWRDAWARAGSPDDGHERQATLDAWARLQRAQEMLAQATALATAARWARLSWSCDGVAPDHADRLRRHARAIRDAVDAGASPLDLIVLVTGAAAELSEPR